MGYETPLAKGPEQPVHMPLFFQRCRVDEDAVTLMVDLFCQTAGQQITVAVCPFIENIEIHPSHVASDITWVS
jgi:hypothetical protein